MGTRINYEIGTPASVILYSNSSHPDVDPEALFGNLVLLHKGAPTTLLRALLAETYPTGGGSGPNHAGVAVFTVGLDIGDRERVLIANVEQGSVSVREVETPYADDKHETQRPVFERLLLELNLAQQFARNTVASADRQNETSDSQGTVYPDQYLVPQVEAYWLMYKALTKPIGGGMTPFEMDAHAFFNAIRGQEPAMGSDEERIALIKEQVELLDKHLDHCRTGNAGRVGGNIVLILTDLFFQKGISLSTITRERLEELREDSVNHPPPSEMTRPRLMPGTVIAFDDEQVIVLEDEDETVLVNSEGVALSWLWEIDGDTCLVVTPYQPTADEIERHCIKHEPYKGFTCVSFDNGKARFRDADGNEAVGRSPAQGEWQPEAWASAMAEIDRQVMSKASVAQNSIV